MSGQEALHTIKERIRKVKQNQLEMFKIIFLDYSMPNMDGPEVAQELKRILNEEPVFIEHPKIYCCSAYTHQHYLN